jgi:hypothetical protein
VAWTGARFVAAGTNSEGQGIFAASTDGVTWQSQPSGRDTGSWSALAAGPIGVVAIGMIDDRSASWHSADGLVWTASADPFPASLTGNDIVHVTGVIATRTGWLAVGRDLPDSGVLIDLRPIRALVWTSTDGLHWTLLKAQPSLVEASINAVVEVDGGFVAVGSRGRRAAIWTSADGRTWTEAGADPILRPPPGVEEAWVSANGVAAANGSIVVVGLAYGVGDGGAPAARAWRSTGDGGWREAVVEHAEIAELFGVTATAGRFVATGVTWPDMSSCLGGIWASMDGAVWRCEATDPAFAGFGAGGAASSPTVEVAVGGISGFADGDPTDYRGPVWWREAP